MGSTVRWRYSLVFYESKSRSFDIDKLFVARYNYDKNGNRNKFETKEDYTNRLREAGLDDETIVRKVYERYNGKTDFEANSKEANENMLSVSINNIFWW